MVSSFGGEPADVSVFHVLVAHHRIQRIDYAVSKSAWNTKQRKKEERRSYAVGCAFRDGFDGCRNNLAFI